jgi:cytochrome c peroxidase
MKLRIVVGLVFTGAVIALAFPVINLLVGAPQSTLAAIDTADAEFVHAAAILSRKCVNCHTTEYKLPFYANFPVAKGLIEKDIRDGLFYVNYLESLDPAKGPAPEVVLAKTEQTLTDGSMPPMRYLALHWDGALDSGEKQALRKWIAKVRAEQYATGTAAPEFRNEMVQPVPDTIDTDPAKVALGDRLFHDKRLSDDNTLSCASCHALDKGGTDQAPASTGVRDQVGPINAPTVFNAVFNMAQFWDGRSTDLKDQAGGPVTNPIEMAAAWEDVIPKLEGDAEFAAAFKAVYPEGLSQDTITDAIAEFEKTLITPDSPFDLYLKGDKNALTEEQKEGYRLFKEFRCATCHAGKAMGGQSFEKVGLKADYYADRGTEITDVDKGLYNVTGKEEDLYKLKTPVLRNIAITFPYLHDAATDDLKEVVRIMAQYQVGETMTGGEMEKVAAFLESLTGKLNGKQL